MRAFFVLLFVALLTPMLIAADSKISDLTGLTTPDPADLVLVIDTDASAGKKTTFAQFEAALNHDSLTGFVAGEHFTEASIDITAITGYDANKYVDHTGVTLTAGEGVSGGGDISANRSFALDINGLSNANATIAAADLFAIYDATTDTRVEKVTFANVEAAINHDGLTNFAANEHFTEASIDHGSIAGLTDGDHTENFILAGQAGGQTAISGTGASEDYVANSTSHGTKGGYFLSDTYTDTAHGAGNGIFAGGSGNNNVLNTAGINNVIVGGQQNTISSSGANNTVLGGYIATVSGAASYGTVIGSYNSSVSANYGTVIGSAFSHAQGTYSTAIGHYAVASGSESFAVGQENTAAHTNTTTFGKGVTTVANYDWVWGNYDLGAGGAATAGVAFKLDGPTANVLVGRHVNSATAGSNTNILKLHTTNASNQSKSFSFVPSTTLTADVGLNVGEHFQFVSNGTAPTLMDIRGIDMQTSRSAAGKTILATAGTLTDNAILSGRDNYISGTANNPTMTDNVIAGGTANFMTSAFSKDLTANVIGGGDQNDIATTTNNDVEYGTIAGGTDHQILGSQWASIGGGRQNKVKEDGGVDPIYSVIPGGYLNLIEGASNYSSIFGSGNTISGYDDNFLIGKAGAASADGELLYSYDTGITASADNVVFAVEGTTGDMHVGARTDQADRTDTNILKLHTTNASNQTNYAGLVADASLTSSDTFTLGNNTIAFGTAASGNAIMQSTTHGTKGGFYLSDSYTLTAAGLTCGVWGGGADSPNVMNSAGDSNHIFGGAKNSMTSANDHNTILGGYTNTISAGHYGVTIGGYLNTVSGSYGIAAGSNNVASGSYSTAMGGQNNDATGTHSFTTGAENTAAHNHSSAAGKGALTVANYDWVWGNYPLAAGNAALGNVAFKLDGPTANVLVGRHVDSATAGSNTNILKLHTIEANNQTEYLGIAAPKVMPATGSGVHRYAVATGTIAAAAVKTLNGTPVELVPAQGAGWAIVVDSIYLLLDHGGTDFDGIAAGEDFQVEYGTSGTDIAQIETTGFMDTSGDDARYVKPNVYECAPSTVCTGVDLLVETNDNVELMILVDEIATGDGDLDYRVHFHVIDLAVGE